MTCRTASMKIIGPQSVQQKALQNLLPSNSHLLVWGYWALLMTVWFWSMVQWLSCHADIYVLYKDVYSKTDNLNLLLKFTGGSKNILEAVNLKLKQTSMLEKSCPKCSCVFTDFNRSYGWALPSVEIDLADFWSWEARMIFTFRKNLSSVLDFSGILNFLIF